MSLTTRRFIKLDSDITSLLCCPVCKSTLKGQSSRFVCRNCHSIYPLIDAPGGRVYDFRIHHPSYLIPQSANTWRVIQRKWEDYEKEFAKRDDLQEYLDEIDSVREVYSTEFHLTGNILDIGGHQGRLRHYLSDGEVPLYLSVDPFIDSFRYANKPNLLKAYPCLLQACNFLSCHAESLPFIASSFDWLHMRSVLDHFADPYMAFKEAYRVLRPNGQLLIGLSIEEKMLPSYTNITQRVFQKLRSAGAFFVLKSIFGKLMHDHNFQIRYHDLLHLISTTGFSLIKEHWQKPPYSYVVYISARKKAFD